jgi:hypothetical protein
MKRSLVLASTFGTLALTGMLINLFGGTTHAAATVDARIDNAPAPRTPVEQRLVGANLASLDAANARVELTNQRNAECTSCAEGACCEDVVHGAFCDHCTMAARSEGQKQHAASSHGHAACCLKHLHYACSSERTKPSLTR